MTESWFTSSAGSDIRGITRGYVSPIATETGWNTDARSAISQPSGNPGAGMSFPLSISEFNEYVVPLNKRVGTGAFSGHTREWFLRSPGAGTAQVARISGSNNVSSTNVGDVQPGIRPAVWVRP